MHSMKKTKTEENGTILENIGARYETKEKKQN